MKHRFLFALWGALFILCAGLGFIPDPTGPLRVLLTGLSVLCFLPPAVLVWKGRQARDRAVLALVRNLSIASLSLSVLLIIANFLTAFHSELLGNILHALLVVVSSPMICSGNWAMSLFFWACLLIASLKK
ncbi:MAG: hypothetical protein Q4F81_13005 [Eubacteriales bacterium]|nr:hypothetical protein [Eubacteriales bacterium]